MRYSVASLLLLCVVNCIAETAMLCCKCCNTAFFLLGYITSVDSNVVVRTQTGFPHVGNNKIQGLFPGFSRSFRSAFKDIFTQCQIVSDIAIFVLKRDVKLQLTNTVSDI